MLRGAQSLRARIPNRLVYSGRQEERKGRPRTCSRAAIPSELRPGYESVSIARLLFLESLLNRYECLGDFVPDVGKIGGQQRPLGIDDDVRAHFAFHTMQPDGFPEATPHAIALHAPAQCLADRKPNTQSLGTGTRFIRSRQIKNRHVRRKVTSPLFVNSLKIRVLQEPLPLRESVLVSLRHSGFRRQDSSVRNFAFAEALIPGD